MNSPELLHRLAQAVEKMPAFPRSVQALLELTRDPNCEPKAVVAAIEKDPVITARILKVVNSAFYSPNRKLTSVAHAVLTLGMNTVKNMALAFAASGMLPARNEAGFQTNEYLMHSLAVAGIARHVARRMGHTDTSDAYIVGLLHDFGKIVFAQFMPQEFRRSLDLSTETGMPLVQAERQIMGTDHTVASAMLMEHWKFPEQVVQCVANHHAPDKTDGLARSLFLANQLAKHLALGHAGDKTMAEFPLVWELNLGNDWDEMVQAMPELEQTVAEARLFAQPAGSTT